MGEVLAIEEIEQRFASEWVLLDNVETTPQLEKIVGGKVLWHSKDRDEVYRKALELRPKHSALFYAGTPFGEIAINL